MHTFVPYDVADPKTRLSDTLSADERTAFARLMLDDVVEALRTVGASPTVLATGHVDVDVPLTVDDRSLTAAVNDAIGNPTPGDPRAVVAADLPLVTPRALDRLFRPVREKSTAKPDGVQRSSNSDTDGHQDVGPGARSVTIAPGRGGGTNALVVRHPDFAVDFHGVSVRDHRAAAASIGAPVTTVDSFRLATDVDERADLAEVLLHGRGRARTWLAERFAVTNDGGRVTVERTD